jgi:hypothetical protein
MRPPPISPHTLFLTPTRKSSAFSNSDTLPTNTNTITNTSLLSTNTTNTNTNINTDTDTNVLQAPPCVRKGWGPDLTCWKTISYRHAVLLTNQLSNRSRAHLGVYILGSNLKDLPIRQFVVCVRVCGCFMPPGAIGADVCHPQPAQAVYLIADRPLGLLRLQPTKSRRSCVSTLGFGACMWYHSVRTHCSIKGSPHVTQQRNARSPSTHAHRVSRNPQRLCCGWWWWWYVLRTFQTLLAFPSKIWASFGYMWSWKLPCLSGILPNNWPFLKQKWNTQPRFWKMFPVSIL